MSWNVKELAGEIQNLIWSEEFPRIMHWADKRFNNVWSKSITRFENALDTGLKTKDWKLVQLEADVYKTLILELLDLYRKEMKFDERDCFLKAVENRMDDENRLKRGRKCA